MKTRYDFKGISTADDLITVATATDGMRVNLYNAYELLRASYEELNGNADAKFDTAMQLLYQVKVELDCIHGENSEEVESFANYCRGLFGLNS